MFILVRVASSPSLPHALAAKCCMNLAGALLVLLEHARATCQASQAHRMQQVVLQAVTHLMGCTWMLMALVYISWFEDGYDDTWIATARINLQTDSLQSKYIQVCTSCRRTQRHNGLHPAVR
jgi:hypothetical protein